MKHTRSSIVSGLEGREIINLALLLSFPVISLDEFLRTPPAQLLTHPVTQAQHWVTDSLMILPLFVVGVWAGDWTANRAGLSLVKSSAVFKRALLIVLLVAIALIPVWFVQNKTDNLIQSQALVTPHSKGGYDVYWVSPQVIWALVCVFSIPAAAWAARAITRRLNRLNRLPRTAGGVARASVLVLLVAAAPVLTWGLHQVAERAYASQVDYTSALLSAPVHSHAFFGSGHGTHVVAGPPVTAAPYAPVYQIAHALQDGLAGQAVGLPVAVVALLWATRELRRTHELQLNAGLSVPDRQHQAAS